MGLDAVGKTTLLYRLKLGGSVPIPTIPTIGAHIETITHLGGPTLYLWDIGGKHSPVGASATNSST